MKQALLVLGLLLACIFSGNAQSDATWEETIGFIKKYKYKIEYGISKLIDPGIGWRISNLPEIEITLEKMKFVYKINHSGTTDFNYGETNETICQKAEGSGSLEIPFENLMSCTEESEGIRIELTTNDILIQTLITHIDCRNIDKPSKGYFNKKKDEDKYHQSILIKVSDIEMRERLSKAFSHLAKLATEKREAERKASGDKF